MAGDRPDDPIRIGAQRGLGMERLVQALAAVLVECPHCGATGPHPEVAAGPDFEQADCRACGQRFELPL
jgi:transcription elongation factor Elf1